MSSSIGFRYLADGESSTDGPRIVYFGRSTKSRPVESEDIDVVLDALKFDQMQDIIRAFFEELQELMEAAFAAALRRSRQAFELELDLFVGWQILAHGFARSKVLQFASVQEFEQYLVNKYRISQPQRGSRADVLASTSAGL